jgi:tetratricopeptide (TPR) repeat protein
MISEQDDHIAASAGLARKKGSAASAPTSRGASLVWGDRILFSVLGILIGFAGAYLYLERAGRGPAAAVPGDPHAGLPGFAAGATRDLPGSGGGAPGISMNPAMRQQIEQLQAAVEKDPNNGDLLVQLGNAAYDAEDSRLAVDAYERAIKIRGEDPNVLTDLGVSYRNLGDLDKAIAMFRRALKVDPSHWQAKFNMAVVIGVDKGDAARAKVLLAELRAAGATVAGLDSLEKRLSEQSAGK